MGDVLHFPSKWAGKPGVKTPVPIPKAWEPEDVALVNLKTGELLESESINERVYREPVNWDKVIEAAVFIVALAVAVRTLLPW